MRTHTVNETQRQRDIAAVCTATVVARAMQVRHLTRSEAVELVASHTAAPVDHIEALLDRASLVMADEVTCLHAAEALRRGSTR